MELFRMILRPLQDVLKDIRQYFSDWHPVRDFFGTIWEATTELWQFDVIRYILLTGASIIGLWFSFWLMAVFNIFSLNTDQEGWRAGTLNDFTISNRVWQWVPTGWLFPTGEGYLLLGNDSSRNGTLDGKTISPSYFSTDEATFIKNKPLINQPVVIHFRVLHDYTFLGGETNIRATDFQKQQPVTIPASCAGTNGWFTRKQGMMGGKVVEAATVGHPLLWKTYEVIIHTGGNEFKQLSITDSHIFECAVTALKTGQSVRLTYDNDLVRDPITQRTTYNIVGVAN
jgi:hypothetical protein